MALRDLLQLPDFRQAIDCYTCHLFYNLQDPSDIVGIIQPPTSMYVPRGYGTLWRVKPTDPR